MIYNTVRWKHRIHLVNKDSSLTDQKIRIEVTYYRETWWFIFIPVFSRILCEKIRTQD